MLHFSKTDSSVISASKKWRERFFFLPIGHEVVSLWLWLEAIPSRYFLPTEITLVEKDP